MFRTEFGAYMMSRIFDFFFEKIFVCNLQKNPGFFRKSRAQFFRKKIKNPARHISAKFSYKHVPEVRIEKY